MAPVVSLQDQVERLSACVAGLARFALAGKLPLSRRGPAAAAAGVGTAEAGAFLRGETLLPSGQSVALIGAILEQSRMAQVNYMQSLKGGHAGSNLLGASFAAKVVEDVAVSRGRTEHRESVRGGALEVTQADVDSSIERLVAAFGGWKFEADGTPGAKLIWRARHADHGQQSGACSLELAQKVLDVEASAAVVAEERRRFLDGRGSRRAMM
jgi:hypothetical protein